MNDLLIFLGLFIGVPVGMVVVGIGLIWIFIQVADLCDHITKKYPRITEIVVTSCFILMWFIVCVIIVYRR